ncbi:MAG: hypothetical protein LUC43_07165 [Burkholderiales bacterium]|nr:hypothetical protein [Burkholderiales bacterium]
MEEKLKRRPNLKNIIADPDKKKADITFSIRSKKESFLSSQPGSGSTIIAMASKMINAQIQKLEKEKKIMQGTPIELAKKSVNESSLKAITKTKTQEMEEQLKKENLYPFNKEKPVEETLVVVTHDVTTPTEVKRVSGFTKFLKSVFTFFRGSEENAPPAVNSKDTVKESTGLDANSNTTSMQVEIELSKS